jgi:peptidoglycan/LPS O-acetylase OafA/YrhL
VPPAARVSTVDCLRGIAALAVVWFHLTHANLNASSPAWLRASGSMGWLGVEAFFVISGFVIPLAMARAGYRRADYGAFLLRRLVRLEPPYLASMALAMALAFASAALPGFRGLPPSYPPLRILSHLGYVNLLFGYPSIIVAYWSLSLEFQYYLLMGLLFPLIGHSRAAVRLATVLVLLAISLLVPSSLLVFHWLSLFVLGILAFYVRERTISVGGYFAGLALASTVAYLTLAGDCALVALATSLMIAFVSVRSSLLLFLGDISYSLYLVHVPVGGAVINAGTRLTLGPAAAVVWVLTALATTIIAAYAFHRVVERPARVWASRLPYGHRREPRLENSPG